MGGGFHGAAVITLDAKGRVAIPTRHRDAVLDGGKSLVVTAHPDGCVLIYPANEWEPVRLRRPPAWRIFPCERGRCTGRSSPPRPSRRSRCAPMASTSTARSAGAGTAAQF